MVVTRRKRPMPVDLLTVPLLGRFLRWRHARTTLQVPLLLLSLLLLDDGFFGPQLAPENLAGVLPWVQWRGFLILGLLIVGNLFCMSCPFMLPRRLAKKLLPANRTWPRMLRLKWLATGVLVIFFYAYEAFSLWASPLLTAWVALAYFVAAFVIDGFFQGAAFCKYVCPIGQFNFVNSLASPFEIKVRQPDVCARCTTKDCIHGRYAEAAPIRRPSPIDLQTRTQVPDGKSQRDPGTGRRLIQNGCELGLFQERKVGNLDCTFCLDCIHACPHDNVGILARVPTSELWDDPRRSSVGRLGERTDLAALALVLVCATFLNAFGMVAPVYAVEQWLAGLLGTTSEALILLVIFGVGFGALPLAAWASRTLAGSREPFLAVATRSSYALVPVGFGMWLAHYSFHFLTGALTIVPVAQSFLAGLGLPGLGAPRWGLGPLVPASWLLPIELVFLEAGLFGSWLVAYRISRRARADGTGALPASLPWALLAAALAGFGVWLLLQPTEMRGTFIGGG